MLPAPTTEDTLEDLLSRPTPGVTESLAALPGDILILGAGGKMGPSLARMARRARGTGGRVVAVSRWGDSTVRGSLERAGVETVVADLLDPRAVAALPDAPHIVFMAGQKFGTSEAPSRTWAMNALVPAYVAGRYPGARIVVFAS